MKKAIALFTVIILIFTLAGCAASPAQEQASAPTSDTQNEISAQKDIPPTASNDSPEQEDGSGEIA